MRIGHGYDAHRLTVGRDLILGGVKIAFERGLDGHSDADVLLHALCDALLGAATLGDIGVHFPPTEEQWRGADSRVLLAKTYELVRAEGYTLGNADMTIIMQVPRLAEHLAQMRANIAETLGCAVSCVSVKATTEEKMGFTGSGEGVSAHAVVLLENIT